MTVVSAEDRIRARARAHQRRFLRRIGARASDLDAITIELLRAYVRKVATIEELEPGELRLRAENASARALRALEQRLAASGLDGERPAGGLAGYLSSAYSKDGTGA